MKKWFCLSLCLVMVFACATAFALTGQLESTRSLIDLLEEKDRPYAFVGLVDDGNEVVDVLFASDALKDLKMRFIFDHDDYMFSINVDEVIRFKEEDREKVLDLCNRVNNGWMFSRFVVDDAELAVNLELDSLLPKEDSAYFCEMMMTITEIIMEDEYPQFLPYGEQAAQ